MKKYINILISMFVIILFISATYSADSIDKLFHQKITKVKTYNIIDLLRYVNDYSPSDTFLLVNQVSPDTTYYIQVIDCGKSSFLLKPIFNKTKADSLYYKIIIHNLKVEFDYEYIYSY